MGTKHTLLEDKRNGNYYVRIRRQGVKKYFNLGVNRRKAHERLKQLELDIANGKILFSEQETSRVNTDDGKPDIRLEELIDEYLEWVFGNLAKSTYETRKLYLNGFLEFVGESMVSTITPLTLSKYYAATRQRLIQKREAAKQKDVHGEDERFTSENAGHTHLRHVKTMLKWGESMGLCKCSFDKFPAIKESPARLMAPKSEDVARLLTKMSEDMKEMTTLEILTGIRPQELLSLNKESLHQENGQACLILKPKSERLMRQPKPRVVPLSHTALDIILRAISKHPDSSTVFVNDDGKPFTAFTYRQRFQRWCKRAGIKRMPPYALRHFFGTQQAGIGTNNQVLSHIMGHTTTRTLSRYVEPVLEHQQKAMDAHEESLSNLLKSISAKDKAKSECAAKCVAEKLVEKETEPKADVSG